MSAVSAKRAVTAISSSRPDAALTGDPASSVPPHRIYPVEKNGHDYFMIKFKTAAGNWTSKYAPVSCADIEAAERWFVLEYVPSMEGPEPAATPEVGIATLRQVRTFATLAPLWLDYRKSDENLTNYRGHLQNWILPHAIALEDLEAPDGIPVEKCRAFIRSIDRAPFTVRNIVQTLRTIVFDARKEGWVGRRTVNMFAEPDVVDAINQGETVTKVAGEDTIVLATEQAQTLLACTTIPLHRRARYWLAIGTGMRDSEIAGLQWRDFDDNETFVRVDRQLRRKARTMRDGTISLFKPPKKNSYRTIPLHPEVAAVLTSWRAAWAEYVGREPKPEDPVFPDSSGQHYHPRSSLLIRSDLRKAGLAETFRGADDRLHAFDFHSTRRTFASMLEIEVGCERARISALLGHKSGGVTARHYLARNLSGCAESIAKLPLSAARKTKRTGSGPKKGRAA